MPARVQAQTVSPTAQRALALYGAGKEREAEDLLTPYLRRERCDPHALGVMAQIHFNRGRVPQSEFAARQALALGLANATTLLILARALWAQNRAAEARPFVERAVQGAPTSHHAWAALAHIAATQLDYDAALTAYERSLDITRAQNDPAIIGYTQTLSKVGRRADAVRVLREACAAQPLSATLASELASTLNYLSGVGARDVADAHFEVGRRVARRAPLPLPSPSCAAEPDRRLRVGLLSGDLRTHAVTFFLEPILAHRDPAAVEYVAFSTRQDEPRDAWAARVRAGVAAWHCLVGLDEVEACRLIMGERPDILIDLAGYTHLTGVWLMSHRLAPVQVTYLGYPHSTGLGAMDYRLVSSATDPPGSEALSSERLLRLDPCMHVYVPPPEAPAVADPGARPPGPVRFGSFNNAGKISDQTLDLWARVLAAVPGGTLLLKSDTLADAAAWRAVLDGLSARGVDRARVSPLARTQTMAEHLALYHGVDIALDTTPYNGTTTTCEALWMGVPVVAMWGDRHGARVSGALLAAAGVPELCAADERGYVDLAVALAGDEHRRVHYRRTLRAAMAGSVLCDGPGMARRFESALRAAWRTWCDESTSSRRGVAAP